MAIPWVLAGYGNERPAAVMGVPLVSVSLPWDHPLCSGPVASLSVSALERCVANYQPLPGNGT